MTTCYSAEGKTSDFYLSPETLMDMMKTGQPPLIIDVRSNLNPNADKLAAEQYAAEHVTGARFLPFTAVFSKHQTGKNGRHPWPEKETVRRMLKAAGADKNEKILFCDDGDMTYAARAVLCAMEAGFTKVHLLDGGLAVWKALGGAMESGEAVSYEAETCCGNRCPKEEDECGPKVVSLDEMVKNLETHELLVLDARPLDRFMGQNETIDPAAGHIPGALSRPASTNRAADGRIKSPEALKIEFDALLAGRCPKKVVHSCGSGVAACSNILAMVRAGLTTPEEAMVFAGSWSEWSAHPELPIATGK